MRRASTADMATVSSRAISGARVHSSRKRSGVRHQSRQSLPALTVHYEDSHDRIRIAVVGEGSLLGEGAFFSHLPRSATVSAGSDCRLWCLTPLRFRELCTRAPEVALELTVAMSAVLARRMYNKPKRVAVT